MELFLVVNGRPVVVEADPVEPLLHVLREQLGLAGAKEPCGKGECGGCTVLLNGTLVNACLVMAAQAEGAEILTVEGLVGPEHRLHPIQEAFVAAGAVQCGYCMPGMVMAAYSLLQQHPHPSAEQVRTGMEGNLCRCTGYQKIFDAVTLAASQAGR
ncbi:MAG TPA: (2Fe-2S)-binding protein [Symbiobacteriaceae bacterium]|jgi:carbon-monoxide dehydrogenase small subunit|nr:(2Fe-2S)-binding protein [Symbiobacteriaceae bacterium]